jgi:hypothetical protein
MKYHKKVVNCWADDDLSGSRESPIKEKGGWIEIPVTREKFNPDDVRCRITFEWWVPIKRKK